MKNDIIKRRNNILPIVKNPEMLETAPSERCVLDGFTIKTLSASILPNANNIVIRKDTARYRPNMISLIYEILLGSYTKCLITLIPHFLIVSIILFIIHHLIGTGSLGTF